MIAKIGIKMEKLINRPKYLNKLKSLRSIAGKGNRTDSEQRKLLIDYSKMIDFVLAKLNPDKMNYAFIDEIKLLQNWQ
jgi:hypothetical protein